MQDYFKFYLPFRLFWLIVLPYNNLPNHYFLDAAADKQEVELAEAAARAAAEEDEKFNHRFISC